MTVYVDGMVHHGSRGRWCHMWSENLDELHAMADKIGLKRRWFQNHPLHPHYDLVMSKRRLAIQNGAVACSEREMGRMILEKVRLCRQNIST
jgi:hypothetical protein